MFVGSLALVVLSAHVAGTEASPARTDGASVFDADADEDVDADDDTAMGDPTEAPATILEAPVDVDAPEVKDKLAFADHLFLDGDWYRAITEYRRYLWTVKGRGPEAPRAAMAIGEGLLRGEQYDAAGRQLDGVAQRTTDAALRNTALFGAARAYLLDGRPELAKPRFRLITEDMESEMFLREESAWLLAWGHFDAGELEQAKQLFATIGGGGGRYAEAALGAAAAIDEKENLDTKNIFLAAGLSLIPGLGHMYLGQWGVGVTSLGWNGLFIVATVLAWVQGQWGPAIVLTLFSLGFYSGGIFGALSGAYRHNRDVVRNWRDRVLLDHAVGRDLPEMHNFESRHDAKPGSLVRFGGAF